MNAVQYQAYLNSPHWRSARAAGQRCESVFRFRLHVRSSPYQDQLQRRRCPQTRGLEVHHRNYERLGRERPEDLVVLCRRCHKLEHLLRKQCAGCGDPVFPSGGLGYADELLAEAAPYLRQTMEEWPDLCPCCQEFCRKAD